VCAEDNRAASRDLVYLINKLNTSIAQLIDDDVIVNDLVSYENRRTKCA
jgi:hypothetical protein